MEGVKKDKAIPGHQSATSIITEADNSFSGKFGWLPSVTNIFFINDWYKDTKKAVHQKDGATGLKMVVIATNTSYHFLNLLRFCSNRALTFLTGGIILIFEAYAELSKVICLLKIYNSVKNQSVILLREKQRVFKLPGFLKILIPTTDQLFHKTFFSRLEPIPINEIKKEILKTLKVLLVGITTIVLTAITVFTPFHTLGLAIYITLLIISSITYYIRYYAANAYLAHTPDKVIELQNMKTCSCK